MTKPLKSILLAAEAYYHRGLAKQKMGDMHGSEEDFAEAQKYGRYI